MSESAPHIGLLAVDADCLIPLDGCSAWPADLPCGTCRKVRRVLTDPEHRFHGFYCDDCKKFEQCSCIE